MERPDRRRADTWQPAILAAIPNPALVVLLLLGAVFGALIAIAATDEEGRGFGAMLFLAGLVFGVGLAIGPWLRARQVRRLARDRGLSYVARDDALIARLGFLDLLTPDARPEARNLIRGGLFPDAEDGLARFEVVGLDAQTPATTQRRPWSGSALLVVGPWATPRVVLTALDHVAPPLERVAMELDDFNQTYRVWTSERKFAFALLHPRAIEAVTLVMPPSEAFVADLHRGVLVIRREPPPGSQGADWWDREDYDLALGLARGLLERVPSFLLADHAELTCEACGATQPGPVARCTTCDQPIETEHTRALRRFDTLSWPLVALLFTVLFALPCFNLLVAAVLGQRWQRQGKRGRLRQLNVALGAALALQVVWFLVLGALSSSG